MKRQILLVIPIVLTLIVSVSTVVSTAFAKASSSSYSDGYRDGVVGGSFHKSIGEAYDDKCPSGHSMTYCQAFADGYEHGWKSNK